jgi:hypothetical protein
MNDLLDSAIAAHGGLDRWNQVKSITFDASITGAFWHLKARSRAPDSDPVCLCRARQAWPASQVTRLAHSGA